MSNDSPQWGSDIANVIATAVKAKRKELGMSAQQLADRTEELGNPVSRTAIADYELGRRKDRLMLGDALILLHILGLDLTTILAGSTLPDGNPLRAGEEAKRSRHAAREQATKAIAENLMQAVTSAVEDA